MSKKFIQKALDADAFDMAERVTGESYKSCKLTEAIGVMFHFQNTANKQKLLEEADDTTFSNTLERYLRIAQEIGFKLVHQIPFIGKGHPNVIGSKDREECQYFLYKPGVILEFDTYDGNVNSSNLYYCWKPKVSQDEYYALCKRDDVHPTSSGCWHKVDGYDGLVWAGDHDGREALRFHVEQLEEYGNFLYPWPVCPYYSFCTYEDYNDTKHVEEEQGMAARYKVTDEITASKLAQLPEEVRAMFPAKRIHKV